MPLYLPFCRHAGGPEFHNSGRHSLRRLIPCKGMVQCSSASVLSIRRLHDRGRGHRQQSGQRACGCEWRQVTGQDCVGCLRVTHLSWVLAGFGEILIFFHLKHGIKGGNIRQHHIPNAVSTCIIALTISFSISGGQAHPGRLYRARLRYGYILQDSNIVRRADPRLGFGSVGHMPCSVITGKGPGSDKKLRNRCGSLHTSLHVVKVRGCQPPHCRSLGCLSS